MSNFIKTSKGIITIRPALIEDATLLRELRLEALSTNPEAFSADYAFTEAESNELWVERIDKYNQVNNGVICVASNDNSLIGMSGIVRGNWPKTQHNGIIWGVFVKTEWRGYHIAEAIVKNCIAWAQTQGLVLVKLSVITTNISAIRCYARCGFTVYGIDPKVICFDGVFYDELLMSFPIQQSIL